MLTKTQYEIVSLLLGGLRPGEVAKRRKVTPAVVSHVIAEAVEREPNLTLALAIAKDLHKRHRKSGGR